VRTEVNRHLDPELGDETRYEVFARFALPPGRHQIRFNATSRLADASGSVIADIDVPDLTRATPSASAIVVGTAAGQNRDDALDALLPIVPTTVREFAAGERVTAFVRLFSGDALPSAPVAVDVRVVDASDRVAAEIPASTIPVETFGARHSADYSIELPLAGLRSGLHLLSISATFDQSRIVRRDLVFRVR
jgi:hypothetical protein